MNLSMHLSSHIVLTFEYTGGDIDSLVRQLKPKELFSRPAHQLLGQIKTVTVNPEDVEWVEVETKEIPKNAAIRGTPVCQQLSPQAFNRRVAEEKDRIAVQVGETPLQDTATAFGMATFRSGETLCLEIQAIPTPGDDRGSASVRIFQSPAIVVLRERGGILIVNPKNIVIWQVVPGLKKSAFFSIRAELKSVKRA